MPVLPLPDGDRTILIASNFGRPHHPSWYHNLRANPFATIVAGGVTREVVARELHGAEREQCYRRGEVVFPGVQLVSPMGPAPDPGARSRPGRPGPRSTSDNVLSSEVAAAVGELKPGRRSAGCVRDSCAQLGDGAWRVGGGDDRSNPTIRPGLGSVKW